MQRSRRSAPAPHPDTCLVCKALDNSPQDVVCGHAVHDLEGFTQQHVSFFAVEYLLRNIQRQRLPTLPKTWRLAKQGCYIYIAAAMPFFASLVKCLSASLGCSDCAYNEISIVPTKLIYESVSKFLLEKKLRSLKLGVFQL